MTAGINRHLCIPWFLWLNGSHMGPESLVAALAIIGIVIVVSALLSGLIDRSGLPHVAVFICIGAALGPAGLGVFDMTLESPVLRVVATLSLTLVLFTDAVALNISEVRRHARLAFRMLGPGTIVCAALTAARRVVAATGFHPHQPRFSAPRWLQPIQCCCADCCGDVTSRRKLARRYSSRVA